MLPAQCAHQAPTERVWQANNGAAGRASVRVCVLLPSAGRVVYLAMLRSTAVVAGAKARALSRPDRHQVRISLRGLVEGFTGCHHQFGKLSS